MLKIGLTGGIGSGKSTVAAYFAELGVDIIDADTIARELLSQDTRNNILLTTIIAHFGSEIVTQTGTLNRSRLRALIFADDQKRAWLEQLLHPLIRTEIQNRLHAAQSVYCILMIPLLLEKNMHDWVDRILVVDTSETLQIKRLKKRDHADHTQATAILAAQISRQQRLTQANDIINNDGTLDALKQKVASLHRYYLSLAEEG